jgi:MRG-binding protein
MLNSFGPGLTTGSEGMHKHAHMISIMENFRSNGYGSGRKVPAQHVRSAGIWAKLRQLYDLDALDQRENAHAGIIAMDDDEDDEDEDNEEDNAVEWTPFELPQTEEDSYVDFGELMWDRRLLKPGEGKGKEKAESPQRIPGLNETRSFPGVQLSTRKDDSEEESEEDEDEEDEEVEEKPAPKGARGKRTSTAGPAKKPRRGGRRK